MFLRFASLVFMLSLVSACSSSAPSAKHLFILSGQSNMSRLDPALSFTPAVEAEFGADKIIVVKDAAGGQPIRRWYKKWKPAEGELPKANPDLYQRLMTKVIEATEGQSLESVTLVWMQGERDAREKHGEVYAESLQGILNQLKEDIPFDDIHFVVGRLSDFAMTNKKFPHWTYVRQVQVDFCKDNPTRAWVDTDDLNDGFNAKGKRIKNDLHYSVDGYVVLGERFAAKAIQLIQASR